MIIKCVECKQPMSDSQKNRPADMPPQNRWVVCRQCNGGVEVIGDDAPAVGKPAKALEYEETVYITIKQTKDGIIKSKYSDKERKVVLGEEKLG